MEQPLLTSRELARALHVSPRTITRWVEEGILTPTLSLPGRGRYRWRLDHVERQLAEHAKKEQDERDAGEHTESP